MGVTDNEKRMPSAMRVAGFSIDQTCYPWFAYIGHRFWPDEFYDCYTDLEEDLLGKVLEDSPKPLYPVRHAKISGGIPPKGSSVITMMDPGTRTSAFCVQPGFVAHRQNGYGEFVVRSYNSIGTQQDPLWWIRHLDGNVAVYTPDEVYDEGT